MSSGRSSGRKTLKHCRRAGIFRTAMVLLLTTTPSRVVQANSKTTLSEVFVSVDGDFDRQEDASKTVVNQHAVLQVHVAINCTEPDWNVKKWSVILDELLASDENSTMAVHLVQSIALDWSSGLQGVADLSFVVPASVSRTFILSLMEHESLVTRRLANVHAVKTLDSRGSPVVSVVLQGTTVSSGTRRASCRFSSPWKMLALLVFSVLVCRFLLVSGIMSSCQYHPRNDDEDEFDGGSAGSSEYVEQSSEDDDEMTFDTGYDASVSSEGGLSQRGPPPVVDTIIDDDDSISMMPPTVFRYRVDPSMFDQLQHHHLRQVSSRRDFSQSQDEQRLFYADHHVVSTPPREDPLDHQVDNGESRNVSTPTHQDPTPERTATSDERRNHATADSFIVSEHGPLESLPTSTPIEPVSEANVRATCEAGTNFQETSSVHRGQTSQDTNVRPPPVATTDIARSHESVSQSALTAANHNTLMPTPSVIGIPETVTTKQGGSEASRATDPVDDSSLTVKPLVNAAVVASANEVTAETTVCVDEGALGTGPAIAATTKDGAATEALFATEDVPVTAPENELPEATMEGGSGPEAMTVTGTTSTHAPVPDAPVPEERTTKDASPEAAPAVLSTMGVERNEEAKQLESRNELFENATAPSDVGIETEKTLPRSDENPCPVDLKPFYSDVHNTKQPESAWINHPSRLSPVPPVRYAERKTGGETTAKSIINQPALLSPVPSARAVDKKENWLQRLARPKEQAKGMPRRSGQTFDLQDNRDELPSSDNFKTFRARSAVLAAAPSSQASVFQLPTHVPPTRDNDGKEDITNDENWLQRLRSRSSSLQSGQPSLAAGGPNTDTEEDEFSYVSTLPPDSDTVSIPETLDFAIDEKSPEKVLAPLRPAFKPRSVKRKRGYGGVAARTKSQAEKAPAEVSPGSTTSMGPGDYDDNEVIMWEPTAAERSSRPPKRKKRRVLGSISNAVPDAIPSLMVVAKQVNAPVWQFNEATWSSKKKTTRGKRTRASVDRSASKARERGVPGSIKVIHPRTKRGRKKAAPSTNDLDDGGVFVHNI